ncbi:MAG: hypothetical protein AAB656_00290 [Patescibacteria group bacterium]
MKVQNRNKFFLGKLENFQRFSGYFVGRFMGEKGFPVLETDEVEIAWKKLPINFHDERSHFHKKGVEINIVIKGKYKASVNGELIEISEKEFLIVYPQTTLKNISATEGTELVVIKAPSISNDKFDTK